MKYNELLQKNKELRDELRTLKRRYKNLEQYSKTLEKKVHDLRKHKKMLLESEFRKNEEVRKKILKDKEIKRKDFIIEQIEHEIKNLKKLVKTYESKFEHINDLKEIKSENRVPIIILNNLTVNEITNANNKFGLTDQIIYFKDSNYSNSGVKKLISLRPRFVCGNID
ncbi:MAG: hypothetical protein J7K26_00915, partial [Candidatus Aenigmarchaeota archaeon]|nr:hypothetical protein [Candidatus Aenigmarchaeota archaeon]